MRYFFDHCLSFRYAKMLRALEVDAVALQEEISPRSTDIEIFKYLKDSDCVFVTENRTQLTRDWEAVELKAAGINAIYFAAFWSKLGFWGQASWLLSRWPKIEAVQKNVARGTIVEVKQNGKSLPIAL